MSVLLCLAALLVQADRPLPVAPAGTVLYVVDRTTPTYAAPDAHGRELAKLKAFDIVSGTEAAPGWLQIDATSASADVQGRWLAIDRENIVSGSLDGLKYRIARAQLARWPERVRLDIARGRIRYGFSAEQVRLALGDPRSTEPTRSTSEPAEAWSYDTMRVVVSMRGVTDIRPMPQR